MKRKALTIIAVAIAARSLGQTPTLPNSPIYTNIPGVTMPAPPQPASLMPNVITGFPQAAPAPNPFGLNHQIQQQNQMLMQEAAQWEQQRRLQQQRLFAEIEQDILKAQVQYQLPDLSHIEGTKFYRQAFAEISDMLDGKKPLDLKRAVFLVENAYLDNRMDYGWFGNDVLAMKEMVEQIMHQEGYSPDDDLAKKWAQHQFMSDTVQMKDKDGKTFYTHTPFGYDFEDPFGKEDWSKMFVTKLMKSKKGQCHSLPLLYLILAEQLGVDAYLSFAPQHSYIRLQGASGNWYNLELTVGRYSSDSWLTGSGFIKADALLHKMYMDTLGKRDVIAACLFDLAKGYTKKYGFDRFVSDCTKKSLEHCPNNVFALQLYSDYHTVLFHHLAKQLGFPKLEELQKNHKAYELYLLRNQIYDLIDQSGFEPMPEEAYQRWLQSFESEAAPSAETNHQTIKYNFMKQILTLAFCVLMFSSLFAQHEPLNPYETIGKKAEVLTLSKGKYQETFSNDTIMRIGSVMYHRFTGEVVIVVTDDTLYGEYSLQPEVMSRWLFIDPLAADFPEWSPYVYTLNNPIIFIDPDGKSPKPPDDYRLKQNGTVELIRKTDDATDKLFAYHLDGEPTGAYLEVNKGILQTYAEN